MTDRIQLILKSMNLSPSQFADAISVQRSSLSHILSGRNKPSLDFVTKVLTSYPEISSDWLLFGTGTMIRKQQDKKEEKEGMQEAVKKPEPPELEHQKAGLPTKDRKTEHAAVPETSEPKVATRPAASPVDRSGIDRIIILHADQTFKVYNPS